MEVADQAGEAGMAALADGEVRRLTAAQIIVLAGEDLVDSGISEFSEWQLTVASWRRDRQRFGLRGYQDDHPDHKRVMMEIMGSKPHNPIQMKLMEKVRPNYYRMTPNGRAEAARLRAGLQKPKAASVAPATPEPTYPTARPVAPAAPAGRALDKEALYDGLADFAFQRSFGLWKDDPDQPHSWAEALGFLSAGRGKPADCGERWQEIDKLRREAMDFCDRTELDFLPATGKFGARRLSMADLGRLGDFLLALRHRFPDHLPPAKKLRPVKA
jgi:hypothetical protein